MAAIADCGFPKCELFLLFCSDIYIQWQATKICITICISTIHNTYGKSQNRKDRIALHIAAINQFAVSVNKIEMCSIRLYSCGPHTSTHPTQRNIGNTGDEMRYNWLNHGRLFAMIRDV